MSQTGSDQPSDYQLDSEPSDSKEIEEQHEREEQHIGTEVHPIKVTMCPSCKGHRSYLEGTRIALSRVASALGAIDVYDLSPTCRVGVLLKANISWKNWKHRLRKVYDRYSTNSERMENIPKRTKKEDWESFIEICSTDEEKIKREKGKLSREHMKLSHTSGRLGCARIEEELIGKTQMVRSQERMCLWPHIQDEIKRLVSLEPYLGEKDLDNDPVARVIGRDGKGRVRGLRTGVTKTVVHASAPYIKIVEEEKRKRESTDENVKLVMQRLDEETRERKILAEKLQDYAPEFENTSPQYPWTVAFLVLTPFPSA
ncbi:hypothetical protein IFM89_031347 [Coptis chinensis]|uniref:Uncharacterized protein n=1 Tax=Coptis chinensis TaxID=261450 RepID=A0A835IYP6_9MAGN|nr:hypothetical protein IFM89_031347 [Coptis chinensis]